MLPARGEPAWVVAQPDAARAQSAIHMGGEVRLWENDDAFPKLAQLLKDRGAGARVGIEERVRFAVFDGLRKQMPACEFVSADAVTVGCRMIKSPAEIALLQRANDITIACLQGGLRHAARGHDPTPN